jgi:hypothetical protein
MKHKTIQTLYAYWNEVRAGRMAPRRFEIEPARIAGILADTFILELAEPDTYRYRLAGTRICEQFGQELRGADFLASWSEADRARLAGDISHIVAQGGAGVIEFIAMAADGSAADFEAVLLPLVHTNNAVDRILGAVGALDAPDWLGTRRLLERRLASHQIVWPDGRPHALIDKVDRQAPFLPGVRHARLVRSDRRQFRVYDGGLARAEEENR